jgi:hypothetical protein
MTLDTHDAEELAMLLLARKWKAGELGKVHPSIGRIFNRSLLLAGEEAVPFARATDESAPSVPELILREHMCAQTVQIDPKMVAERAVITPERSRRLQNEQVCAYDSG